MTLLVVTSYIVTLVVLALVIGFSPVLYSMMVRFAAGDRANDKGNWLIAGVIMGIVCMFLIGGTIAFVLDELRTFVMRGTAIYQSIIGVIGGSLVCYALMQDARANMSQQLRSTMKRQRSSFATSVIVLVVGFVRTVSSVSGLAAVIVLSSAITTRSVSWPVAIFVLLPLVCAIAIIPFLLLSRGDRLQKGFYQKVIGWEIAAKDRLVEYRSIATAVLLCLGMYLVAYAARGVMW